MLLLFAYLVNPLFLLYEALFVLVELLWLIGEKLFIFIVVPRTNQILEFGTPELRHLLIIDILAAQILKFE